MSEYVNQATLVLPLGLILVEAVLNDGSRMATVTVACAQIFGRESGKNMIHSRSLVELH